MLTLATGLVRRAMMDFGFGSFLDKFEKRFGGAATTVILILIALSVASFCMNITATYVVLPVIAFIQTFWSEEPTARASVSQTTAMILNLILFAAVMAGSISAIRARQDWKTNAQAKVEYEEFLRAANEFWADSSDYIDAINRVETEIEAARSAAKRKELVAELRSRVYVRQAEYASKISKLNQNIRDMRGE